MCQQFDQQPSLSSVIIAFLLLPATIAKWRSKNAVVASHSPKLMESTGSLL